MLQYEEIIREESKSICRVLTSYMTENEASVFSEDVVLLKENFGNNQNSFLKRAITIVRTVVLILAALAFHYFFLLRFF
ncbi:hypothetical protein DEAC_c12960 [Desulfosporosinus acididurans]|uniref:Uncharacterized protein n=2 Tax=Desulfosporosinus acididurans TaxID=476652 RepID=A0A0J1FT36_9FIRM|nr:hypothetical protein DEAC_c12960 [Desulfosporosinus acididurans]